MTIALRRFHLDGLGPPAARFDPLTVDLADGDQPVSSAILFLENGGGKSVLLRLLFSVVLAGRRNTLGSVRFDRYVGSGDTGHVVLEWDTGDGILVTGTVFEWRNRTRSGSSANLLQLWYAFTPEAGVLSLDDLPIRLDDRRVTRTGFRDRLQALARAHPALGLVVEDSPQRWTDYLLRSTVIDPETFRYQRRMNADESDAESLFADLKTDDDFVRFVIEAVHDPEELADFGDLVEAHAGQLGRYDELITERQFCLEAAAALQDLAVASARLEDAAAMLAAAGREAAHLRARLAAAAAEAVDRSRAADERVVAAEERVAQLTTQSNQVQTLALEHRRLEAGFLLAEAEAAAAEAEGERTAARQTAEAWRAVGNIIGLRRSEAELAGLHRAQEAVERDLQPLRAAAEAAAARYAGRLLSEVDDLRIEAAARRRSAEDAAGSADRESASAAAAQREAGTAGGRADLLREQASAVDSALDQARVDGLLGATEPAAEAVNRAAQAEQAGRDALASVKERLADALDRLSTIDAQLSELAGCIAGDESRLVAEQAELEGNQRAALRLVARPRVQEIAPGAEDLWLVGDQVTTALALAMARNEAERLALDGTIAEWEAQLEALSVDGLLPPHPDLTAVLDALASARIAATTGWRYLAQLDDPSAREQVLARNPALAGGVIVHDPERLDEARQVLVETGVEVGTVVVLGPVEALDIPSVGAVAAPVRPALYDPTWTERLRQELGQQHQAGIERRDQLAAHLAADGPLRGEVAALLQRCPPSRRTQLAEEVAALDRSLRGARSSHDLLTADQAGLRTSIADLRASEDDLRAEAEVAADRLRRLRSLAERDAEAKGWRLEIQQLDEEVRSRTSAAAAAEAAAKGLRSTADEERSLARQITTEADRRKRDAEALAVQPAADEPGPTTEALAGALSAARAAYDTEREGRDLTPEIQRVERQVASSRDAVVELPEPVRQEAEALALEPGSDDPQHRRSRVEVMVDRAGRLDAVCRERDEALGAARRLVADRTPANRPRHTVLDPEDVPADAVAAATRASELQQRFQRLTEEQRQIEEQARADRAASQRHRHEAQLFGAAVQLLDTVDVDGLPVGEEVGAPDQVEPWGRSVDLAAEAAGEVRHRYDGAARAMTEAVRDRDRVVGAARAVASDRAYAGMGGMRVALAEEGAETLAARAGALARELTAMAQSVEAELVDVERHREGIVIRLSTLAESHLRQLGRMKQLSKLPEGLGDWSGQSFLSIEFEPASPAEVPTRLGPVVNAALADPRRRKPISLLMAAMQAVVARRRGDREETFRVRLLRPNRAMTVEWAGVAELGSEFSGGMKLTAAICTYCTLAALRAGSRSSGRLFGHEPGPLFLDNPLGKASADYLLDLQHAVARRLGVQLVNTTGVWDVEALASYERVVRLRNLADMRQNIRRLRVDDEALSLLPGHQSGLDAVAFTVGRPAP